MKALLQLSSREVPNLETMISHAYRLTTQDTSGFATLFDLLTEAQTCDLVREVQTVLCCDVRLSRVRWGDGRAVVP